VSARPPLGDAVPTLRAQSVSMGPHAAANPGALRAQSVSMGPHAAPNPGALHAPLRRSLHRGSVVANGLYVDVRSLGAEEAKRRILALWTPACEVHRLADHLVILFRDPARLHTSESPGGLLVRQGNLLSAVPLEKDELAAHDEGPLSVLLCEGGMALKRPLGAATIEDPSSWMDTSDFTVVGDIEPLGRVLGPPARAIVPVSTDVRAALGQPEETPGAAAAREAILASLGVASEKKGSSREMLRGARGGGGDSGVGSGFLGGLLRAVASLLAALLPLRSSPDESEDEGSSGASGEGRGSRRRGLAVRDEQASSGLSPWDALSHRLRVWAARFLVWSRLAQHIGRRQAEYLSRMMEMFDQGDLDAALRHAIALGGEGGGPVAPALGTPSPRGDLRIAPRRAGAGTAMLGTADLLEELRRVYRRAFEQLDARGEIDKAAFVLAELLQASEEAVSFLERHQRFRLAAEIAEARDLPAGLVVRQWILAKEVPRAVKIARARGAFAEAVSRLDASGHKREAASLRVLWADHLATSGDFAGAIQAIWPVEQARPLAREWLDRAIASGGPVAARMAIRKVRLVPEAFSEVRDIVVGLLREPGEDGLVNARAVAAEITLAPPDGPSCALAKPALRALMRAGDRDDTDTQERLLRHAKDAALTADVRRSRAEKSVSAHVRVTATASTAMGHARKVNEDAAVATTLTDARAPMDSVHAEQNAAQNGLVLLAVDGLGGWPEAHVIAERVCAQIVEELRGAVRWGADPTVAAAALERAISGANRRLFTDGRTNPALRGVGATLVAATIAGDSLVIGHVGDCRAYLCRAGRLTAVTRDHSLVEALLDEGKLTPEEVADFPHKNVIMRALGVSDDMKVDLWRVPLCNGDVLLLCSDGLWNTVEEAGLTSALASRGAVQSQRDRLLEAWRAARGPDDLAMVVARFEGKDLPSKDAMTVLPERVEIASISSVTGPASAASTQGANPSRDALLPLRDRPGIVEIHVAAGDVGALPIFDAAELPDGRILVALGEAGSRIVAKDGRTIARFREPAHRIVISDHGDRALVLAPRGDAQRIARIDLVGRREQAWCDARIGSFAADFDGSIWYVSRGGALSAIDATDPSWTALWSFEERGAAIRALARGRQAQGDTAVTLRPPLHALVDFDGSRGLERVSFSLPDHRILPRESVALVGRDPGKAKMRARPALGDAVPTLRALGLAVTGTVVELAFEGEAPQGIRVHDLKGCATMPVDLPLTTEALPVVGADWLVAADVSPSAATLHVVSLSRRAERARIVFEGAGVTAGARLANDRLMVFDNRGRLTLISLRTGKRIRDLRLS